MPGCIRNVTVNNVDIGPPTAEVKTQDCYRDSPSAGVSFEDGGGFLKVGKSVAQAAKDELESESMSSQLI